MEKELQSLLEGIDTAEKIKHYDEGLTGFIKGAFQGLKNGDGIKAGAAAGSAEQDAKNANKQAEKDAQAKEKQAGKEATRNATTISKANATLNGKRLGPNDILALINNKDSASLDKITVDENNNDAKAALDAIKNLVSQQSDSNKDSAQDDKSQNTAASADKQVANIGDKKGDPNWELILQVLNKHLQGQPQAAGGANGQQ